MEAEIVPEPTREERAAILAALADEEGEQSRSDRGAWRCAALEPGDDE